MRYDVTTKPVGSFFGGKQGLSIACPVCGSPGLVISKDGKETCIAHCFDIRLNRHNEPVCDWGKQCVHRPNRR